MPKSEAAEWSVAAMRKAQSRYNSSAVASEGQHRLAAKVVSASKGISTDQRVNFWVTFQLFTPQQLSCSATVNSGSAMGSMMRHIERKL